MAHKCVRLIEETKTHLLTCIRRLCDAWKKIYSAWKENFHCFYPSEEPFGRQITCSEGQNLHKNDAAYVPPSHFSVWYPNCMNRCAFDRWDLRALFEVFVNIFWLLDFFLPRLKDVVKIFSGTTSKVNNGVSRSKWPKMAKNVTRITFPARISAFDIQIAWIDVRLIDGTLAHRLKCLSALCELWKLFFTALQRWGDNFFRYHFSGKNSGFKVKMT